MAPIPPREMVKKTVSSSAGERRPASARSGDRAQVGGELQQQRQADRDQRRQAVPVVERVGEAVRALRGTAPVSTASGNQAGCRRESRPTSATTAMPAPIAATVRRSASGPRMRRARSEDADVGADPREVGEGLLGALGPAETERGPDREPGEQAQRGPGERRQRPARQRPDHHPGQDDPPDGDPDLVVDERVVAASLEPEVDDQPEAEEPGGQGAPIDPPSMLQRRGAGQSVRGLHPP